LKFNAKEKSCIDFSLSLIKSLTKYEERMHFKANLMEIDDIPFKKHELISLYKAKYCN